MKLYYEQSGQGPDVVLLHGWGLHGGVWNQLVSRLAADFRVTVLDLPGHGRSTESAEYSLKDLIELIVPILNAPAIWIGWSLGALITLSAAQYRIEAVRKMVLVAATPKFVQSQDWRWAMEASVWQQFMHDFVADYRATLRRFLSLQLGTKEQSRALLRELRDLLLMHGAPQPGALQAGLNILCGTDLRAELPSIQVPVQIVHGARDKLVPLAAAQYLAAQLPHARLAVLPAAGHAPFLSHARDFTEVLLPFLYG
ncbi:MAG TPA: pimeloyl-ACP methyl ester esterase BioH [Acidiferrobacterales bacterium]|nr:pimeloyl-ACP methyl ester esterase BioH [Acidiferrobacterales bacterium]